MCMFRYTFNRYCTFYVNQLVLCVAMLLAKNQRSQAAQAMHELGNLQYHASNIRYIFVYCKFLIKPEELISAYNREF